MPGQSADASGAERSRILVVDDELANRKLLRAVLAPSYDVVDAENGQKGLDLLEAACVDLVLLDVMMPGLNGLEVCRRIKTKPRETFLPVILITALDDQEDRNSGLMAGADDFLTKPIDLRELALRVRAFLKLRSQEAQIRRHLAELTRLQSLKDDLFTLILHDLRNPLAGVVGFVELLQEQLRDPAQASLRTKADKALEAAGKVRELVDSVLEVQRLEEEEMPLQLERASLAELAREAAATQEGAALSRKTRIEIAVAEDVVLALDRRLVRRSIENLIANALKYTPTASTVDVAVRAAPGGGVVEIADRGLGIPDHLKEGLFRKFGSVEAKQGRTRRGFGLGLHLVKLVASAHGGSVAIRDREGGGTVFTLFLAGVAAPISEAAAGRAP